MLVVGSTAGHVYPAIAVAEALQRLSPPRPVLFVAGDEGPAARIVNAAGTRLETISGSPIKRAGPIGSTIAVARVLPAIRQSRQLLTREAAALVLGFGSYTAGTVLLAARLYPRVAVFCCDNLIRQDLGRLFYFGVFVPAAHEALD